MISNVQLQQQKLLSTIKMKIVIAQPPPHQQQQKRDQHEAQTPEKWKTLLWQNLHPLGKFCGCKEQHRSIQVSCTIRGEI